MDKRTLEALQKSIQHWESIAEGIGISEGIITCALCQLFHECGDYFNFNGPCCGGCLIYEKNNTYYQCCKNTPYTRWCQHRKDKHNFPLNGFALCKECKEIAWEEVAFLKSLLP